MKIGIPVLNRGDLLLRLLESIDIRSEVLVIRNRIGLPDSSVDAALETYCATSDGPARLQIERVDGNLGVSGSWNRILDWADGECLICNSDIEFAEGVLSDSIEGINRRREIVLHHLHAAACFYVTDEFRSRLGWFDENFHPAYREDQEMSLRAARLGVRRAVVPEAHGRISHAGSQTLHSADDAIRKFIAKANQLGGLYLQRRWGSLPPPGVELPEKLSVFDDPAKHPADWILDMEARTQIARLCKELTGFEYPIVFHRSEGGLCS